MNQVMRVSGHCRLSAFSTGSTCTASPRALSITMPMPSGGALTNGSATIAGLESSAVFPGKRAASEALPLFQRPLQTCPHRCGGSVRAELSTIEIEDPGFRRVGAQSNEHVLQIEVCVRESPGRQLTN